MTDHPYRRLPAYTRWSAAVANVESGAVDPVVSFPFVLSPQTRVATAGSCFAQNIGRYFIDRGFNHFMVEDGHPLASAEIRQRFNYGIFSARYGNVYTARQLRQLFDRAYGRFVPIDDHWQEKGSRFIDPLRPSIQPNGFASLEELRIDRVQHLRAVRRMFEELDIFIFTLGLTECWYDRRDLTAYPLCPGVAGGNHDEDLHAFTNFGTRDVVEDLSAFLESLNTVNPNAQIILTVSPVPLAATALDRHVLVSTAYSKAVLRVACEEVCASFGNVIYFPAYEIITGSHAREGYFDSDRRTVTKAGVDHVMRVFFRHAAQEGHEIEPNSGAKASSEPDQAIALMQSILKTQCDEELLDAAPPEKR